MDLEMLQQRAAVIKQVRSFFDSRGYLELDTPLLSPDLIPESCLEVFETKRLFPQGSRKENQSLYLIPSPEIWMKRIIAQHGVNIYQVCKCFRNGESSGHLHNFEFTMLEYYSINADYMDSLALTEGLFAYLAEKVQAPAAITPPFERITVANAFERWAGLDLFAAVKKEGVMEEAARRLGLDPLPGMATGALYDLIFIHSVEPHLKGEKPIVLLDYPAFVPCLAKRASGEKTGCSATVERWELYYNGIELANCFSEETNKKKVREFFVSEAAAKEKDAIVKHRVNHDYWKIFERQAGQNFPQCSGVALGLDRLIMALTGRSSIDAVLPF